MSRSSVPVLFVTMCVNTALYVAISAFALVHGYSTMQTCSIGLWVYVLSMLCTSVFFLIFRMSEDVSGIFYAYICMLAYMGIVALALGSPDDACRLIRSAGIINVVFNLFIVVLCVK